MKTVTAIVASLIAFSCYGTKWGIAIDYSDSNRDNCHQCMPALTDFLNKEIKDGDSVYLIAFASKIDSTTYAITSENRDEQLHEITTKINISVFEGWPPGTDIIGAWNQMASTISLNAKENEPNVILFLSDGRPDGQKGTLSDEINLPSNTQIYLIGYNNLNEDPNLYKLIEPKGYQLQVVGPIGLSKTLTGPVVEFITPKPKAQPVPKKLDRSWQDTARATASIIGLWLIVSVIAVVLGGCLLYLYLTRRDQSRPIEIYDCQINRSYSYMTDSKGRFQIGDGSSSSADCYHIGGITGDITVKVGYRTLKFWSTTKPETNYSLNSSSPQPLGSKPVVTDEDELRLVIGERSIKLRRLES